jgi:vancomycin resistance protein VanJ
VTTSQLEQRDTSRLTLRRARLIRSVSGVALLYPVALLVLSAIHVLAPQREDALALTQIIAPYLFWPLLLLLPLTFRQRSGVLRLLLIACALVYMARFPIRLTAAPPPTTTPGAQQIEVMTWNLYAGNTRLDDIVATLKMTEAEIVALQELSFAQAERIENDPELRRRYPYRLLAPHERMSGVGLLSAYPFAEIQPNAAAAPRWVRIDPSGGQSVVVFNTHLTRPWFERPTGYKTARRDEQIATLRQRIAPLLDRGEHVLLLGDFNLTEREPGYAELTAGLHDTYRLVGGGRGHSWRPWPLNTWNFALLRIDYLLSSPDLVPLRASTDCTPSGSDHCRVEATFELR